MVPQLRVSFLAMFSVTVLADSSGIHTPTLDVNSTIVKSVAEKIGKEIQMVVNHSMLTEELQNDFNSFPVSPGNLNPLEIGRDGVASLATREFVPYFRSMTKGIERLLDAYKETNRNYTFSNMFLDSENLAIERTYSKKFQLGINTTKFTFKEAPTSKGKHEKENERLASLLYESLADEWKTLYATSPNGVLHSQYFGTEETGVLYTYPAQQWDEREKYDPRGTPWYSSALIGNKNVILIVDLTNNAMIHKEMAIGVLRTLAPEDYVAIFVYNGEVKKLGNTNCNLTIATPNLVEEIIAELNDIEPADGNRLGEAFSQAFLLEPRSSCSGNNVIVNIQGSSASARDVLGNSKSTGGWRIFTYATKKGVGHSDLPSVCATDGWYEELEDKDDASKVAIASRYYRRLQVTNRDLTKATTNSKNMFWSITYGNGIRAKHHNVSTQGTLLTISVAVFVEGDLIGVMGMDFRMSNVKDTLDSIKSGGGRFPILYHRSGATLYHPIQSEYRKTILTGTGKDISDYEGFEGGEFDSTVREPMLNDLNGEKRINVLRPLPKGDAEMEGLDALNTSTIYVWNTIPQTNLALCMVIPEADLVLEKRYPDRDSRDIYIMNSHVELNNKTINQADIKNQGINFTVEKAGNVTLSRSRSAAQFAPQCFSSPTTAHDYDWTAADVLGHRRYINLFKDASNGPPFPVLKDDCLLSAYLARNWSVEVEKANKDNLDTVWVYFGQTSGVNTVYPASFWGNSYDPTRRPWYFRARSVGSGVAISTPYDDAGGQGLLNTISVAISSPSRSGKTSLAGVVGFDYKYQVFHDITSPICSVLPVQRHTSNMSSPMCFLIDTAGMLLTHSDFLITESEARTRKYVDGTEGAWSIENIFIGRKEPPLASALIESGFLKEKSSINEDRSGRLYYFEADDSLLNDGVLEGTQTLQDAANDCGWMGSWSLSKIAMANAYVLVVQGYERGNNSRCAEVRPRESEALPSSTCKNERINLVPKAARYCPNFIDPSDSIFLENRKPPEGSCKVYNYVKYESSAGIFSIYLGTVGVLVSIGLCTLLFIYRFSTVLFRHLYSHQSKLFTTFIFTENVMLSSQRHQLSDI